MISNLAKGLGCNLLQAPAYFHLNCRGLDTDPESFVSPEAVLGYFRVEPKDLEVLCRKGAPRYRTNDGMAVFHMNELSEWLAHQVLELVKKGVPNG